MASFGDPEWIHNCRPLGGCHPSSAVLIERQFILLQHRPEGTQGSRTYQPVQGRANLLPKVWLLMPASSIAFQNFIARNLEIDVTELESRHFVEPSSNAPTVYDLVPSVLPSV